MRILHIVPGGAADAGSAVLGRLVVRESLAGNEIAVLALRPAPQLRESLAGRGVRKFSMGFERGWQLPLAGLRLARIVNTFAPDVIHGWSRAGSRAAWIAREFRAAPVSLIWNMHDAGAASACHRSRPDWLTNLDARLSAGPDAIVFPSRSTERQYAQAQWTVERSTLIPHGFDIATYRPAAGAWDRLVETFGIARRALVVGYRTNGHPSGNHAMSIEAIVRARSLGCDLHLLIMDQPDAPLARLAADQLPADRLTFADARAALPDVLPGLDMLVLPGSVNAIGEALACGVPVIAADTGDNAEIIGPSGLAVGPECSEVFAGAIMSLATMSTEQRRQLGRSGRQRIVNRYAIDDVLDRYCGLHRQLHADARYLGLPSRQRQALADGIEE